MFSFILVPLLMGIATIGFGLIRAAQANQINRDAGHMFARGVDFSGTVGGLVNRGILVKMAPSLAVTTSSGTAVLVLSAIEYIGPNTCTGCANQGYTVFTKQITLGNASLKSSGFGTVPSAKLNTDGSVINYLTDTTVRATGVQTILTLGDGDVAYVSETYLSTADLSVPGFPSPAGASARAFF